MQLILAIAVFVATDSQSAADATVAQVDGVGVFSQSSSGGESDERADTSATGQSDVERRAVRSVREENYVGVETAPVPPAVSTQLASVLNKGQGLLITQVLAHSPAQRAGLKQYDVLSSYNGQPLSSSAELKQRIVEHEPGRDVELGIIRGGQPLEMVVTLGRRDVVEPAERNENALSQLFQDRASRLRESRDEKPRGLDRPAQAKRPHEGRNVTVLISRLDQDRWRAEIELLDAQHQSERWQLQGTHEEVLSRLNELPNAVHETVRHGLKQAESTPAKNQSLRFQFQPLVADGNRSYRILFCRPSEGGTRVLGLEQSVGHDDDDLPAIDELLQNRELNKELQSVSPPVRSKIERALRTLPIKEPPVDTSASQ